MMRCAMRGLLLAAGFMAMTLVAPQVAAQDVQTGSVTRLPVPRYVSLKSDRVNLREGPSKDHRTRWVYQRAGLPVEIVAEFEIWRRVRDADGADGWVLNSLLSGRRTALVAPWSKVKDETFIMRAAADEGSAVVAQLRAGVIANVDRCADAWCKVGVGRVEGYVRQERLWGVYPNERID
jgi:SH3-like domain-containing protein